MIALGIFMMLQPFALVLYTWSFVTTLARHRDVHRRLQVPGLSAMAEIRVENLHKAFADFVAVKDSTFTVARRRVLLPARALGLRQDDDAAHDRRPRAADLGPDLPRRRGRHLQARLAARHRLRVPAVRALPAHERAPEHRLPAGVAGHAARRDRRQGRGGGAHPAHRRTCSTSRSRACRAATASASRSAARSCASRSPS